MSDISEEERERLREEARQRADALRLEYTDAGNPMGWFEALYGEAGGTPERVPWAHGIPRPEFVEWLEKLPEARRQGRALDIGCGLGDNAAILAQAGFEVTAFDISGTAIRWAARRYPDLPIDWRVADILDLPAEFEGAFDLVNETYTLQALRPPYRERAIENLPRFVKPGGILLIVTRGRHPHEPEDPPPWPLLREELEGLETAGLKLVKFEDFHTDRKGKPVRHFRLVYRRM